MICPDCYGNGTQDRRHDCPTCDGSGITSSEQRPSVPRAERGRGVPMERHADHFVMAEPEPMREGFAGKILSWLMRRG